jgi:hypothetical protein
MIRTFSVIAALLSAAVLSTTSAADAAGIPGPRYRAPFSARSVFAPAIAGRVVHNDALYGVSCVTWTNCLAVGARVAGSSVALRPLAEQWTGTRWQVAAVPDPVTMPRALLANVSCKSRDDCVAAGYHYGPSSYALLAEFWNGHRWRIIRSANPVGMWSAFFNDVGCQWRIGCIAVGGHSSRTGEGQALAERWADGHWQVLKLPSPAGAQATELNGISCDGGICVAVGMYLAANGELLTLAERWNGKSWQLLNPISARAPMSVLYDVSCASARACMAVGGSVWTRQYPLTESWRNGRWQLVPGGKVAGGSLSGVSCQVQTWCMAVGAVGAKPLTEAWFGKDWQVTQTQKAVGPLVGALSQLSCRTYKGRCVTVGARLQSAQSAAQETLAEWWGRKTWHLMTTRNP